MLAAQHRMRSSGQFTATMRGGRRSGTRSLVVHHLPRAAGVHDQSAVPAAVVGLVVGRVVGNSVQRHRVSRRLRAQLALRLSELAPGSATVVRALPSAAGASSAQLGGDLDRALRRLSLQGVQQ